MAEARGEGRTRYGAAPSVALRGVGLGAMLLGGAIVVGLVVTAVGVEASVLAWAVAVPLALVAAAGLALLVVGLWRLSGRGLRLELDDDGFLNATGPGAGVRRAAWGDVRTVRSDGPVVVVDLAGGRRSIVRTGSLSVPAGDLAAELRRRLDRGHGYRRLT
jgi:hypothetical protein